MTSSTVEQTKVTLQEGGTTKSIDNLDLSQYLIQKSTSSNFENNEYDIPIAVIEPPSLKVVLSSKKFQHLICWFLITFLGSNMKITFISAYGAAYFAGCHSRESNLNCNETNYSKYNLILQISNSCAGCLAFLSASFVGRLSDKYGRKPFMYFFVCLVWIPYIFILFSNNVLIFIALLSLVGLSGNIVISGPIISAYIADIFTKELRLYAFGVTFFLAGVGLILGTLMGYAVAYYLNDFYVFILINGFLLLSMIYLRFFVEESLDLSCRSMDHGLDEKKIFNPMESVKYLFRNKVILNVALISSFSYLTEAGLTDIIVVVLSDIFASSANDANLIALLFLFGSGVGFMFAAVVTLPVMKRHFTDIQILFSTLSCLAFACVCHALLFLLPYLFLIPLIAFILAHGMLGYSPMSSIQSRYVCVSEQGIAFGVVYAVKAIIGIIAPVSFAFGYKLFDAIGFPTGIFFVALLLVLCGIVFVFPLRRSMRLVDGKS